MIGEREYNNTNANYGALNMRTFDIAGNKIDAFYDAHDNLVFVLDDTLSAQKPNVLLVINPVADKKWDEILSNDYNVDLETIRPKVDNKYQKLDIEYSGLNVYENLINAYNAGDALDEYLNDLTILRDSAARHSAMMRLNVANETIAKTNQTIVKTKESIVRLEVRIKTLRSKLSATKKDIGKVNTKQSAAKILKLESQIEATNEKLKRAKKRLESAQKRLEVATVDAELASDLLNQPSTEIKQKPKNKPVMVAPEYPVQTISPDEEEQDLQIPDDSGVVPLFDKDPQILNEDIAFKPISFDAPVFNEINENTNDALLNTDALVQHTEERPVLESLAPIEPVFNQEPIMSEEIVEEKPVLETFTPVIETTEPVVDTVSEIKPVVQIPEPEMPVAPIINNFQAPNEIKSENSKPGFVYYVLLLVLILLSVFTLWLYQKNMPTDISPILTANAPETKVVETPKISEPDTGIVETSVAGEESAFIDEAPADVVEQPAVVVDAQDIEEIDEEPIMEPDEFVEEDVINTEEAVVESAPVVIDAVPVRLNTSGLDNTEPENFVSEDDILARKPIYEPGAKHDNMFTDESSEIIYGDDDMLYYDDEYYDAEEAAYMNEIY